MERDMKTNLTGGHSSKNLGQNMENMTYFERSGKRYSVDFEESWNKSSMVEILDDKCNI